VCCGDQLDFSCLLDRQVGRLVALENPAGIVAGEAVCVRNVRSVAQQPSGHSELAPLVDHGHRMVDGHRGELLDPAELEFQPDGPGSALHFSGSGLGLSGIGRVDEQGYDTRRGKQLMQQLQPLRRYLHVCLSHARDVATWSSQTRDEADSDRIGARFEDDRNRRVRRLCRQRRRSAGRGNHGHLIMNQIGRHRRQPITSALPQRYSIATLWPST
jgi:hypothetical protein